MSDAVAPAGALTPLQILWQRRWVVVVTFLVGTVAAAAVSKSLDPVFSADAKLLVVQSSEQQSFDAFQAAQVSARTYADILDSRNTAQIVATRLGGGVTSRDVERATAFEPIPETQLLRITAEWASAEGAQRLANVYAEVFEGIARDRLRETTQTSVTIADRAAVPRSPVRPKPTLYTMLAGLLALALGVALAFLRDRFDTRVEGADELERDFGLPTLARFPRRGTSPESISRYAEAARILRVAVAFASAAGPPRSVVVTSANEGEGKTTTARQLALACAEAGQHVMLVEADVYRPSLRASLGLTDEDVARTGLTGYLLGQSDLPGIISTTGVPKVQFIASGTAAMSLASLLETDRGRVFVAELEERADIVIFDCPPVAPRADAAVLAARAGATVLVVDTAVSDRNAIGDALRALRAVRADVLGVVLNRTAVGAGYSPYHAQPGEGDRSPAAA